MPEEALKQFAGVAEFGDEALYLLTEVSWRKQHLEGEVSSIKLRINEFAKACHDAVGEAQKRS